MPGRNLFESEEIKDGNEIRKIDVPIQRLLLLHVNGGLHRLHIP